MRALELSSYDGPAALRLSNVPEPAAGMNDALVDVRAIGVNFPDLLITTGAYQHRPKLPFVPGCEIAGQIIDAPPDSGWSRGDRVAAFVWAGGYAERCVAPLRALMRLPEDADFRTGAGMVVNYHTTYFALARRGGLRVGERLLVLGAAGGIGTAAIQVGKGLGASVVGGVADEEQLSVARAAGADAALVLTEGFSAGVKDLTDGHGVNVVLDPLGDWLFSEGLRCLAPEGRILIVGFAAGEIPTITANRLLLRNVSAVGVGWGAFLDNDPTLMATAAAALTAMYTDGIVAPRLASRIAFEELPCALERLRRGAVNGKLVADGCSYSS